MKMLYDNAVAQLNIPYHWGGDNPLEGFDCSGLVGYLLKSCGSYPKPGEDLTAQGLFDAIQVTGKWNAYVIGALSFYGESVTKITHVGMLLDQFRMIEAGGGDHLILTREDAAKKGACVKISMVNHRKDLVAIIKPSYASIGYMY